MNKLLSIVAAAGIVMLAGCDLLNKVPTGNDPDPDPEDTGIEGVINAQSSSDLKSWTTSGTVYHITGSVQIQTNVVWGPDVEVLVDAGSRIDVEESGALTIKEGVTVKLGDDAYFEVGNGTSGKFIALGTKDKPVTFTKSSSNQSTWGHEYYAGINLNGNTTSDSKLDYCVIEYASAGIYADDFKVKATNCTIRNNKNYGITFNGTSIPADTSSFTGNTFSSNGTFPIIIPADGVSRLPSDIVFEDNGKNLIDVLDGDIVKSGIWRKQGVPYQVEGRINVYQSAGVSLTFEAGVTCEMKDDAYFEVGNGSPGTFIAVGTKTAPITFTKSSENQSTWGHQYYAGINLNGKTTSDSKLDYCVIEYASAGIYADDAKVKLTNSTINNNKNYGITFNSEAMPADTGFFKGNTFSNNGGFPIIIPADGVSRLPSDIVFKDNTEKYIDVQDGDIVKSGIWRNQAVPYLIEGRINVYQSAGVSLTIAAGVICEMKANAYFEIGNGTPGTFIAVGTKTAPITFKCNAEGAYWGHEYYAGININAKATSSTTLENCIIENSTGGIYVADANTITISNCTIKDNKYYGIYFYSGASPKDSSSFVDNTITGNGDYPIKIDASELGKLSGTGTFSGNEKDGIYVLGTVVTKDAVWKALDVPYIVKGRINIDNSTGVKVTIQPGVEMQFEVEAYLQIGSGDPGTLIANGTADDPITFTGIVKDSYWGYGAQYEKSSGGIYLSDKTTTSTSLTYCVIEKASTGINVDASVTIKNCTIKDNKFYGMIISKDTPTTNIADNEFSGNGSSETLTQ